MMSLFSRGASPPPVVAPPPQNVPPMASMGSQNGPNSVNNAINNTEPASHVIHSPLPSRPSPVQPASTIDELLSGFHSNSPQPSDAHTPPPQQAPPVALIQAQPQISQDRNNNMDLLAMLSNPANNASPASVSSSQPVQKQNPDQANAGRMLLDSLLRSVLFYRFDIPFQFAAVRRPLNHRPGLQM
jgi:hypothetical protein